MAAAKPSACDAGKLSADERRKEAAAKKEAAAEERRKVAEARKEATAQRRADAQAAADAQRRARAEEQERRRKEKAAKAAEKAAAKAAKETEAAAKRAEKAAQAEQRHAKQRDRQEQRERERDEAEIEAMLRRLPPSVLDGSTAGDNFVSLVRRCAQAVARQYPQFAAALKPLCEDPVTIATRAFHSTWQEGLMCAYAQRAQRWALIPL